MKKLKSLDNIVIGTAALVVGLLTGAALFTTAGLATGAQIEAARKDIADQFLNKSSLECNDPSDPTKPADRVAVFYKYLRVNKFANRAVIRGCNNIDSLLAKTKDGTWTKSTVNLLLDTRANPKWQKECQIEDITVADDTIRPENDSIDATNLTLCKELKQL